MNEIEPKEALQNEVDETSYSSRAKVIQRLMGQSVSRTWSNANIWRVVTLIIAFVLGVQVITTQPLRDFYDQTNPDSNGFVAPRDLGTIIDKLDKSVVTIYCEVGDEIGVQGTAWAFKYEGVSSQSKTALMTNHHVIEDCVSEGTLTLEDYWGKQFDAELENFDEENDLAIVSTSHKLPTLKLASYPPLSGYWVAAYGSADGYSGSVAVGNIINLNEYGDLLITANLSGGNSGGPLIDNEGNVFGVNTWSANNEKKNTQYNISVSLDSFCDELIECDGETFWDWD